MTVNDLMLLAMIGGIVALTVTWSVARWRSGASEADPGARLLASVAIVALGWIMGAGTWSPIGAQLGAWFWIPYATAVGVFVADWVRESRVRRGAGRDEIRKSVTSGREGRPCR